jgi:tetratricopeptide (TPR) repeat protein
MKKILGIITLLSFSGGALMAQLPNIKGAESLLNQVPADVVGAKRSIDKAASIGGAEALPYFWLIKSSTYTAIAGKSKLSEENPEATTVALEALNKYFETVVGDKKAERRYGDAANELIYPVAANAWNAALINRRDTVNKLESCKKADGIYTQLAKLTKYDETHDEILKTKSGNITYNAVLKNAYQNAYFGMKDYTLTRKYIDMLIANKYDDPSLYVFKSRTYESEGNKDKQLETIKAGRTAYPDSKDVIAEEINYYISNDKLIVLKNAIDKEIASGNASSTYYYIRGYVNDQIGIGTLSKDGKKIENGTFDTVYLNKAVADYKKAIDLDPANLNAIFNLGTLYANLGNFWNKKASNLPYSATALYTKYTNIQNDYYKKSVEYYNKADGFTGATALTKNEKLAMYTDMKQMYAKIGDRKKVLEINDLIRSLRAQ